MAVRPEAAVDLREPSFTGEQAELLGEIFTLFRKLWDEHFTSPIFAGEEMIFTLGGNGYVIVFSQAGFGGLVEIRSPHGAIDLRPEAESGRVSISRIESFEEMPADKLLRDFISGISDYYRHGPRLRV